MRMVMIPHIILRAPLYYSKYHKIYYASIISYLLKYDFKYNTGFIMK